MIEIELPDGAVVEFPDGTTDDVIQKALSGIQAPQPKPSVGRGIAAASTSALARGGSSILDTIQDKVYSTPPLGQFSGMTFDLPEVERPEQGFAQPAIDALRDIGNTEAMVNQQARPDGPIAGFAYDAGTALTQMVPSIATGFVTKSPNLALAMMGIPAYGNAYEETLLEGGTQDQAVTDGVIALMTELGPEKLFGVWEKALGVQSAKDLLGTMAREAFSEVTTEELNTAYDVIRGRYVGDTGDILARFGHAGLLGAVLGGGMSLPNYLGNKLAGPEPDGTVPIPTDEQSLEEMVRDAAGMEPLDLQQDTPIDSLPVLPQPVLEEPAPTMVGASEVVAAMQEADRLAAEQARARIQAKMQPEPEPEPAPPPVREETPLPEPEPTEFERTYAEAKELAEMGEVEVPPKPPGLLETLAGERIRLDRRKFQGDLAENVDNIRVGNKWLFEGKNSEFQDQGMGPEELLTFLIENKYMNEPPAGQPTQVSLHDAVNILNDAIMGEDVISQEFDGAWADYQEALRYNMEVGRAQSDLEALEQERVEEVDQLAAFDAIRFGEQSDPTITDEEWNTILDERYDEYVRTVSQEVENVDERAVQEPSEPGSLVPEATPQETVRAAEEAKTAERNRLGQDEVPVEQGEGELFAGNVPGQRPEQTDLVEQAEENLEPTLAEYQAMNDDQKVKVVIKGLKDLQGEPLIKGKTPEQIRVMVGLQGHLENELIDLVGEERADEIFREIGMVGATSQAQELRDTFEERQKQPTKPKPERKPETVEELREIIKEGEPYQAPLLRGAGEEHVALTEQALVEEGYVEIPFGKSTIFVHADKKLTAFARSQGKTGGVILQFGNASKEEIAATKDPQNKIITKERADAAKERLKNKSGTLFSGVDPEMIKDLSIVGAYHVEKGVRTFAAFSKAMVKEFGEWVKPFLKDIWAKVAPPEAEAAPAPEPEKPKAKPQPTRPDPYTGEQTSTKNAVTDAERAARDLDPIMREARQGHNAEVIEMAEQAMKNNPDLADEIVMRLNTDPDPSIDVLTEAVLFVHKVDTRREMRRLAKKAADGNTTSAAKYAELQVKMNEIDVATHATGAVWGRLGQLRSRMMNEDYSFEAQIERFQAALGKPASADQTAFIKQQAAEIERLTAELEEANRKAQDKIDNFLSRETHDNLVREANRTPKKTSKQKLRAAREAEIDWLKNNLNTLQGGIPVEHLYHLSKLGAIIIAEGAVTFNEWAAKLKKYIGARMFKRIENDLEEVWEASQDQKIEVEGNGEFELRGVASEREEIAYEIEALAEVGEELNHALVYKLARSFILGGMRGEKQVMQAVHAVLEPHFGVTERDVRRLFSQYGKAKFPSQEEDKKALRELRALVRIQESIDRLTEGLDPLRTGPQRDKATQKIREKQQILNQLMRRRQRANPTPSREKLASIDEQRIRRLENQIKDLEKQLAGGPAPEKRTHVPDSAEVKRLKGKRDALKRRLQEIEEAKKPKLTPEEKYNAMRGKQLRRELAEVARRLREKDYAPTKRKTPPPLDETNRALKNELIQAKIKLHEKQQDWLRDDWSKWRKAMDVKSQIINLSRAAMTSFDLSAVLRQGGFMMLSRPSVAIKSFVPMMRALKNDANANAVNDEILSRPNADLYVKAKLHLSEQDSAHPTKMEEVYMGRWQKKVPGIAASGRAYVTFLNKLRADSFDAAVEHFTSKGQALTMEEYRQLAAYINNATGRYDLSRAGKIAGQGLSDWFFAPRWMLSRFAMIMGQPMWHSSPRMRRYIARQYVKFLMGFSTLFGLAALAFAGNSDDDDDKFWELDPRSTDFGKMRIGNTRLDMMAGLSQPIVFLSRMISGGKKNQKGEIVPLRDNFRFGVPEGSELKFGQDNGADVAWNFLRSKAAPVPGAVITALSGSNVVGETPEERAEFIRDVLGVPKEIAENPLVLESLGLATPLSMRDFYDALVEHGLPKAAALQVLATLGVSMNTYAIEESKERKKKGRSATRPERPKRPNRPSRG